jgi:4,5-dihydroxyphthalate decarboxylase
MAEITLSLACTATDRTRPILDGRIRVPGCQIVALPGATQDIFRRTLNEHAFDAAELSMGSHILTTARGDAAYHGLPVFLSRAFRHGAIYIRTDRGIAGPADLAGKRVGIADYQQTAVLWVRGILADHYGVKPTEIHWRTGGVEHANAPRRLALDLPAGLDVEPIAAGETLNGLLEAGAIDAVIAPNPPSCLATRSAAVGRLFPDYQKAEVAYWRDTGFFPIMHLLVVRKDVAAAHPWLPLELTRAFMAAKALSLAELAGMGVPAVALPWIATHYAATRAIMGANPWRYGLRENLEELKAMTRYAAADGLASRDVDPAELFHPSTLEAADAV